MATYVWTCPMCEGWQLQCDSGTLATSTAMVDGFLDFLGEHGAQCNLDRDWLFTLVEA